VILGKYLTPKQAAEALSMSVRDVYHAVARGQLPAVRIGRRLRIKISDLEGMGTKS
jgi:excisionase family DNA binding protein